MELIWTPLTDSKLYIREAAAALLSTCLDLIQQRDSHMKKQYQRKLYDEVYKGLKGSSIDAIHGSLLALQCLIHQKFFDGSKFTEACDAVFKLRDHKDALVRKSVVLVMPILASFDSAAFGSEYLDAMMSHLFTLLKKEKERGFILVSIGQTSMAVKNRLMDYLPAIFLVIRENLSNKKAKEVDQDLLICISLLGESMGSAITKYMHGVIELLFQYELSSEMVKTFMDLSSHVKPLKLSIQEKLLDSLTLTICGCRYSSLDSKIVGKSQRDHDSVLLALETLAKFDFNTFTLTEIIRNISFLYLDYEYPDIRRESAKVCCVLLAKDPILYQVFCSVFNLFRQAIIQFKLSARSSIDC
jgi:FKBP12-rapamycin complex-associated protein